MRTTIFKGRNAEETKKQFMEALTENDAWFGKLLYGIKHGWIQNGTKITEILIREMQPVSVAVLKAYVPCMVRFGDEEFLPTKHQILGVVSRFTGRTAKTSYDERFAEDQELLHGESIDFSFQVFGLGIFRTNFSYSSDGCTLSVRYLPFEVPRLEDIGYPVIYQNYLKQIVEVVSVRSPKDLMIQVGDAPEVSYPKDQAVQAIYTKVPRSGGGLIVHIGPTGSGKTTAMAAEIGFIAEETAGLILTYEDPIEFSFIGTMSPVSSFELGRDIKQNDDFTLAEMVRRHSLRKNPAVIMFGEMRTTEQMRMVVDMANSGHWVLASMHAQSVHEGIGVLMSVFKNEPHVLANSLQAAVAHRLASNMKGDVVPLFEIFMMDDTRRANLAKGDVNCIQMAFKENLGQSVSFEQSIQYLKETRRIEVTEMDRIRKMALGNMLNEKRGGNT